MAVEMLYWTERKIRRTIRITGMKSSDPPIHLSLLGVVLFGLAVMMIIGNVFSNMGSYFGTMFVKTETPASFDFKSYDRLLKRYTHESRVDYKALKGSKDLEVALADLQKISPEKFTSEDDKLCFWLNAYNLLSMKLICDKYPIASIKELGSDQGTKSFIVGGKAISVKEIDEEKIVPAIYSKNWLLLFAKCNGSVGYPDIADHPYQSLTLPDDLLAQEKKFVLRADNWLYDDTLNKLEVTEFYQWNQHILEGAQKSPLMLINSHLPNAERIDTGTHVVYNLVCQQRVNQSKDWSANTAETSAAADRPAEPATTTTTATSPGDAADRISGNGDPAKEKSADGKSDSANAERESAATEKSPVITSEKSEKGAK